MHIGRVGPKVRFQKGALVKNDIMALIDASAEILPPDRHRDHLRVLIAGEILRGANNAEIHIAFVVEDGSAAAR